jgi:hypothetical protein
MDNQTTGYQDVNHARTAVNVATITMTVQQQQSGSGLAFVVCKVGSTFNSNVYVNIHDTSNPNLAYYNGMVTTTGMGCSQPVPLNASTAYMSGQTVGFKWQLQSPDYAVGWLAQCGMTDPATGTCWYGSNISLTRTCK